MVFLGIKTETAKNLYGTWRWSANSGPRLLCGAAFLVFHNVERESMVKLHAGGTENRAQGTSGPSLLPNHLSNILMGHSQPDNG